MAQHRRRKKKNSVFRDVTSLVTALALLLIAVVMVVFVVSYIKTSTLPFDFSGKNRQTAESETGSEEESKDEEDPEFSLNLDETGTGLIHLASGDLVYVLDEKAAEDYDQENLLKPEQSQDGETTYYLVNSWLELQDQLYHFGAEGYACTDKYQEGAFVYSFDEEGVLSKITYNENYHEDEQSADPDFPGLCKTKALWAFMSSDKTLGEYHTLMYKKTTDSLSYKLGGDTAEQYVSPYAFTILGNSIYYLARKDEDNAGGNSILSNIAGKLFCMTPGAEFRYIAAENVEGFKVLSDKDDEPVIYYYDGDRICRSTSLEKDENMRVFSENANYLVDISELDKAYLTTEGGQKVTLENSAFHAGNFIYSLAADGEILSVEKKDNVSLNSYTYTIENGEAFGQKMCRVIRTDSSGKKEVISGEFGGSTGNVHYDSATKCMVAEYTDNLGEGGLLLISMDGDVDVLTDASGCPGTVTLYGLNNKKAYYSITGNGQTKFSFASLEASTPIAAGIDPVAVSEESESEGADYDTTNAGTVPVQTNASPENSSTNIVEAPGGPGVSQGPGSSTSGPDTINEQPGVEQKGPGSN